MVDITESCREMILGEWSVHLPWAEDAEPRRGEGG